VLHGAVLGRSHRSPPAKARLKAALDRTAALLELPPGYRILHTPGSDTGAMEMAMWSLLGPRPVQVLAFESFGQAWAVDVLEQLKLDAEILDAPYGQLPDLSRVRPDADLVFPWNGTTSGVRVPDADFIAADREGLTLCDATSAAFAMPLDWPKLDVATFSWQKALGGEAAHGMLVLSPRALARLEDHAPAWPVPKLFRLVKKGRVDPEVFEGSTLNTPSMLCVEDYLDALQWAEGEGGLAGLRRRTLGNFAALSAWVERTCWIDFLAAEPAIRSETSVCLRFSDPADADLVKPLAALLEGEGVALDVAGHRDAPPSLRVWCGATVETADVEALTPWLDWAYAEVRSHAEASPGLRQRP
jgi:phosphoserine aminotransferase